MAEGQNLPGPEQMINAKTICISNIPTAFTEHQLQRVIEDIHAPSSLNMLTPQSKQTIKIKKPISISQEEVEYQEYKDQQLIWQQMLDQEGVLDPQKFIEADKSQLKSKYKLDEATYEFDTKKAKFAFVNFDNEQKAMEVLHKLMTNEDQILDHNNLQDVVFMYCLQNKQYLQNLTSVFVNKIPKNTTLKSLHDQFSIIGQIFTLRLSKDHSGQSRGYGFVTYFNPAHAEEAIKKFNETDLDGSTIQVQEFVNLSQRGASGVSNLYVKNIPSDFDKQILLNFFEQFGEISSSLFKEDSQKRTFGFVCFKEASSAQQAWVVLHGQKLGRDFEPLDINQALKKVYRSQVVSILFNQLKESLRKQQEGKNLYVWGLSENVTDENLIEIFSPFGAIKSARVMQETNFKTGEGNIQESNKSKGYGFVCFESKEAAEEAKKSLNDKQINDRRISIYFAEFRDKNKKPKKAGKGSQNFNMQMQNHMMQVHKVPFYHQMGRGGVNPFVHNHPMHFQNPMGRGRGMPKTMPMGMPGMGGMPGMPGMGGMPHMGFHQQMNPMMQNRMPQMGGGRFNPQFRGMPGRMQGQQRFPMHQQPGQQRGGPQMPMAAPGQGPMPGQQMPPTMGRQMPMGQTPMQMPGMQPMHPPMYQAPPQQPAAQPPIEVKQNIENLNAELEKMDTGSQKQHLGELLYPKIYDLNPKFAGKITGMLLEMNKDELIRFIFSDELLRAKVAEAQQVLQQAQEETRS